MADLQQTKQDSAPVSLTGTPFADKTGAEKLTFIGKAVVMLISGGFAYPNIFTE